ncbi:MAG TPA: hypothetical protein VMU94_25165 [Streptosporangiaceae bacterium]|nr:hypothetical protein [Streptosporangiaceae bacterium]
MTLGPDEPIPPAPAQWQQAQDQVRYQPNAQPAPGANQPVPYAQQAYQQQPIVAKNPAISLLLSFFIPGLGSMLNDRVNIGVIILVSYAVGWVLTLVLIGFPILFGVWIWGMIDAYQSAVRWNQAHGIIS